MPLDLIMMYGFSAFGFLIFFIIFLVGVVVIVRFLRQQSQDKTGTSQITHSITQTAESPTSVLAPSPPSISDTDSKIFISHSSRDQSKIEEQIIPLLEQYNINYWYSKKDIATAVEWERSILQGLGECNWFMLVMSPQSAQSNWVKDEVHWAINHREKRIIPIILQKCDPLDFHLRLPRLQTIDFTNQQNNPLKRLIDIITNKILISDPQKMMEVKETTILENAYRSLELRIVGYPNVGLDEVCRVIQVAISYGAPAYNGGKILECAQIYMRCAELLVTYIDQTNNDIAQIKPMLANVIALLPAIDKSNANDIAWKLRHVFDEILLTRTMKQTQMSIDMRLEQFKDINNLSYDQQSMIEYIFDDLIEWKFGNKSDYATAIAGIYLAKQLINFAENAPYEDENLNKRSRVARVIIGTLSQLARTKMPETDSEIQKVVADINIARSDIHEYFTMGVEILD